MRPPREDRELLELLLLLKRRRHGGIDWITIAEKARALATRHRSLNEVASKLQVSPSLLRALLSLTDLPSGVQRLVRNGEILFDAAQRLNTIKDPQLQLRVAEGIRGLPSHAQREAIMFARRNPEREFDGFVKKLKASKDGEDRFRFLVVAFPPEELEELRSYSKKLGLSVSEALRRLATDGMRAG